MVLLISNNPLFDDRITGLPTDDSPETRWLLASHNTRQNQSRMGLQEEMPYIQQDMGATAVQTNQATVAVDDTSGVPPYLKRKLLMHYFATDSDRTSRTSSCNSNCNCEGSGGKLALLGDSSTISGDDGDWIHSDYGDEDEDGPQRLPELGVGGVRPSRRNGEFPPRVRWLRRKHLHLLMKRRRMEAAIKYTHWRHDDDHEAAGMVPAVPAVQLARPQIQDSPPRLSGKRKRNDTETETETAIVRSESYNRNRNDSDDLVESTGKRQRLRSCHGSALACDVAAPPETITGHLSEASALSVGPRRSQRIQEKLGSACGTTRMS